RLLFTPPPRPPPTSPPPLHAALPILDHVVSPLRADGEPGSPSGDYPAVTLAEDGAPSLDGEPEGEAPTKTVVEELIVGGGDTAREGGYLTMLYTGWKRSDGSQFASSW